MVDGEQAALEAPGNLANSPGRERYSAAVYPAVWRKLYLEFGGDLSQAAARGFPIPLPLSVLLAIVAAALASGCGQAHEHEPALIEELRTGGHRIVRIRRSTSISTSGCESCRSSPACSAGGQNG